MASRPREQRSEQVRASFCETFLGRTAPSIHEGRPLIGFSERASDKQCFPNSTSSRRQSPRPGSSPPCETDCARS